MRRRTRCRPVAPLNVHFSAMSLRCQCRMVSGVAIVVYFSRTLLPKQGEEERERPELGYAQKVMAGAFRDRARSAGSYRPSRNVKSTIGFNQTTTKVVGRSGSHRGVPGVKDGDDRSADREQNAILSDDSLADFDARDLSVLDREGAAFWKLAERGAPCDRIHSTIVPTF